MSVLEAPATWIAAAAVLVVIAVVLIALAPRRRSGAASGRSDAPAQAAPGAASAETAPAAPPAAVPDPAAAPPAASSSSSSSSVVDDDDAVTGPVLPSAPREPVHADVGVDDDVRTTEVAPRLPEHADEPVVAATPPMTVRGRYVPVTDPARADGRAKDRLLAALLSDPAAAVDVVAAMPENGSPASGSSAAALLRAGLSPAQVAQLCGVEAGDLATLVARDLGLLEATRGEAQRDRSRTEEPGRAWASAGSAAGSTTPTTG